MKKKLLVTFCFIIGILVLLSGTLYFVLIKDTADYEKTLGVNRATINEPIPGALASIAAASTNAAIGIRSDAGMSTAAGMSSTVTSAATSSSSAIAANTETPVEEDGISSVTKNPSGIIYILLLGTDRTEERDSILGVYRTDTIVIARVDLIGKEIRALNIPRDTYTLLPIINKKDRINAAYAYGSKDGKGVEATIDVVKAFLELPVIDYYFLLEMEPIPEIVDSLGGVYLDVEINMETHGVNLSKGYQLLDGNKAFDYIHWRYSAMGDIDRIKRQQKFAKAMFKKLRDEGSMVKAAELILKYSKNIETSMTPKQLISFAKLASEISQDDISYSMIPGYSKTVNKKSVWVPDEEETREVLREFFQ